MHKSLDILIKNIQSRLDSLRINASQLADRLKVSRQHISAWMKGHKTPSLENIERIATALETTAGWLLTDHSADLPAPAPTVDDIARKAVQETLKIPPTRVPLDSDVWQAILAGLAPLDETQLGAVLELLEEIPLELRAADLLAQQRQVPGKKLKKSHT